MSQSIEVKHTSYFAPTTHYDVAIVGAGPYGLATAAHLSQQGLNTIVFGKPMELWREHMPQGMLLRSFWWATNISRRIKDKHTNQHSTKYTHKQIPNIDRHLGGPGET